MIFHQSDSVEVLAGEERCEAVPPAVTPPKLTTMSADETGGSSICVRVLVFRSRARSWVSPEQVGVAREKSSPLIPNGIISCAGRSKSKAGV